METEIDKFNPCEEAVIFRSKYKTFKQAWDNCPRGDWMLWIAHKLGVDIKTLTLAKVECAKTVIHLMQDERSKTAIKVAEKFAKGEVNKTDLDASYVAAVAAVAAASASYASYVAAVAAAAAADASAASASYASAAAASAEKQNQQKTADICRKILTESVLKLIENE